MKGNHLKSENATAKATAGIIDRNMLKSGARFSEVPETFPALKGSASFVANPILDSKESEIRIILETISHITFQKSEK